MSLRSGAHAHHSSSYSKVRASRLLMPILQIGVDIMSGLDDRAHLLPALPAYLLLACAKHVGDARHDSSRHLPSKPCTDCDLYPCVVNPTQSNRSFYRYSQRCRACSPPRCATLSQRALHAIMVLPTTCHCLTDLRWAYSPAPCRDSRALREKV